MHAGERNRHERISERADVDGPGSQLALSARDEKASRRSPERNDALSALSLLSRPEEAASGAEVEAAERPELDFERALDAAYPHDPLSSLAERHRPPILAGLPSLLVGRRLVASLAFAAVALSWQDAASAAGPPRTNARAVLVADGRNGEVLYARNADRRLPMASITKLMTAVVTLEHADPNETVRVRPVVATVGESSVYLRPGERLSVRALLTAALVTSANDAAYALAAHVGKGSVPAFVRLMNRKARRLGLDDTHFVRPDGLDTPGHYSSARDILALARTAMRRPVIRSLVRLRTARIAGGRSLISTNDLLGAFPGLVGVKTGHTRNAGWCEVAAARRAGASVYAVVLGSRSRPRRNVELARLLRWGLDRYRRATVVLTGHVYASAAVPFSEERASLVAAAPAEHVVRMGQALVERVVAPGMVELPVERGARLGEVRIYAGKRLIARRALVAARTISAPGFGHRVRWYAARTLDEAGRMLAALLSSIR